MDSIRPCLLLLFIAAIACSPAPPAPTAPPAPPAPPAPSIGILSAAAIGTDKGPCCHNYTELYERLFFPWKDDPVKIFEIGVADGGSLKMWHTYFPQARIFAVDIEPKSQYENERVKTIVGDQASREQLQAAINVAGSDIDVLIDDGGHTMEQQQVSLGFLFPHVKPGGYYVIEDVHTSLPGRWKGYGVDPNGANSTLRMIESFIRADTPAIKSRYMTADETAYLDAHIESLNLTYRASTRSLAAVIRKKNRSQGE